MIYFHIYNKLALELTMLTVPWHTVPILICTYCASKNGLAFDPMQISSFLDSASLGVIVMEGEPAAKMKLSVAELSLVTEDEQAPDNLRGALPKINMSVAKMTQEK